MIDYSQCNIEKLMVHHVGNKSNGEELHLSSACMDISSERLRDVFVKMFASAMSDVNVFRFKKGKLNTVFESAEAVFNAEVFEEQSRKIAEHLFQVSVHPNIKSGTVFTAYLTGLSDEFGTMDALAIVKSEIKHPFIRTEFTASDFAFNLEEGFPAEKPDKGAIVFNTNADEGYRVSFIDRSGKSGETGYWTEDFLEIEPCPTDFQYTKNVMNLTKEFVSKKLPDFFEISKEDQVEMLSKAGEYFQTHDTFNSKAFEANIFVEPEMAQAFSDFKTEKFEEKGLPENENFQLSDTAVKKEAKIFKSVIKLDRNFHIYVHGNRHLIEKGYDEATGKKFYKVFFEEES